MAASNGSKDGSVPDRRGTLAVMSDAAAWTHAA
jgi:hypothetical protein